MTRGFKSEDPSDAERERWLADGRAAVSLGQARCMKATPRAVLVYQDKPHRSFWVPQSVIHMDSEVYADGHCGDLVVLAWWAKREGFMS